MLIFSFKFIFARLFLFVYKKSKLIERGVDFLKEGIQKIPSGVRAPFAALNPDNAEKRIFLYINNDFIP